MSEDLHHQFDRKFKLEAFDFSSLFGFQVPAGINARNRTKQKCRTCAEWFFAILPQKRKTMNMMMHDAKKISAEDRVDGVERRRGLKAEGDIMITL